ncbi:MAG: hypothetical protein MUO60_20230 [Clostridiaceae bacterium]|nr:hypothetical protein [Clostridiaceae bacterium]
MPAMMFAHIIVAGPLEGVVTGFVVKHMQKTNLVMLQLYPLKKLENDNLYIIGGLKKYWRVLIIITPLGLIAQGSAYREYFL